MSFLASFAPVSSSTIVSVSSSPIVSVSSSPIVSVSSSPIASVKSMLNKLFQKFEIEFKINNVSLITTSGLKTPKFYPFPGKSVEFYFEIFYTEMKIEHWDDEISYLVVNFVKSSLPSMDFIDAKMDINLNVYYGNSTEVFRSYKTNASINLNEMRSIECIKDCSKTLSSTEHGTQNVPKVFRISEHGTQNVLKRTEHGTQMLKNEISLKCSLEFSNHLCKTSQYSKDVSSLESFQSFSKNLNDFYHAPLFCDVDFKIQGEVIRAHKVFLVAHSPVFKKMFESDFLESNSNTVIIDNVESALFKKFLHFLYCGEIDEDVPWNDLKELYVLSDKYDVAVLKDKCTFRMELCLNKENVFDIFELVCKFNDGKLKKIAQYFTICNYQNLVNLEEWNNFTVNHPDITSEILTNLYYMSKN